MTSPSRIAHCYDRRSSPVLALTEGAFQFLHTSIDRIHGIASRGLKSYGLGVLPLPSGHLMIGDPFSDQRRAGHRGIQVPPGRYGVWQTLADVGGDQGQGGVRVAYLSLVLRPDLLKRRQSWQEGQMAVRRSPALPVHALRYAPLCWTPSEPKGGAEGGTPEDPDHDEADFLFGPVDQAGVVVQSGTVALADAWAFARQMPSEGGSPGTSWYDRLFEHGLPGSWFDLLDSQDHLRRGAANLPLPGADVDGDRVVLSQSGWGDGTYLLLAEYALDEPDETRGLLSPPLVALHLDFRVVPFCPSRPILPMDADDP